MIYVDSEKCAGCGVCEDVCPVEAIRVSDGVARIDQNRCNECEACVETCPNEAILAVIEPAEEKALSLREQPSPEVALAELHRAPAPLQTKVVPVVGAALAFLGREVAPRLATYLVDALDRRLSHQPTLQPFDKLRTPQAQDTATVSSTKNLAPPSSSGKSRQKGRRRRRRRGN
jgi:NAD-dependent dihydropyrimidine dehydrogenase PreA subunit